MRSDRLKRAFGAILLVWMCLPVHSDIKEDRKAYIRKYAETAVSEMYRSGIPALIPIPLQSTLQMRIPQTSKRVSAMMLHNKKYVLPDV